MQIKIGIPTTRNYFSVLNDESFKRMEIFSNKFLESNKDSLMSFSRKWVSDPLHHWSRQWEYPFIFSEISKYIRNRNNKQQGIQILDAGSGMTFFPFYIASSLREVSIRCCDMDASFLKIFQDVSHSLPHPLNVNFDENDIHCLSYPDNSFDILYCISVLEHTKKFETILQEFQRVLKPSGVFTVTFDISLNGGADITIERAELLLQAIKKYFTPHNNISIDLLRKKLYHQETLTTHYVKKWNKHLLPWKHPFLRQLKSLIEFRLPAHSIPNLTIYCNTFINKKK